VRDTSHTILCASAADLSSVAAGSVALMVTSPPYPMVAMWNDSFSAQDPAIGAALAAGRPEEAFEGMHRLLDRVWAEVDRLLMPGGIACVNIGDATRTEGGDFRLFSNHSRVISAFLKMGYLPLPDIIWRKPTNAPNKFLGSGMYPPGAYVTFEHEYILIFRKGSKRAFHTASQKQNRRRSAYFWEERNRFFTDLWELTGTGQNMGAARSRSGAFPLEIAHRLILMFSVQGDVVLDPFGGTMTTARAAMQNGRNSLSVEIEPTLCRRYGEALLQEQKPLALRTADRIRTHMDFVAQRRAAGDDKWYINRPHGFEVKTRQETALYIPTLKQIIREGEGIFRCNYT
jgi:DNA modification methylase